MSGYENVLPARSKVIDPSSGDIVVDQKLALVRPALRVSGGFGMPSLFAPARFVCVCVATIQVPSLLYAATPFSHL
jgi:hypothetical protein